MKLVYKGYEIRQGDYGLEATHPDYDGTEDRFHFVIGTDFNEVLSEIDERVDEHIRMWGKWDCFMFFGINKIFRD